MANKFKQKPLSKAIAVMLGVGTFAAALTVQPVLAQESSDENAIEEEEVVVTGIRRSLQRSMDLKRNASQIIDSITAEDIGKLPDENAAASLKRITGVQIGNRNGLGSTVRIRGLSNVTVLLDGAPYTGTGVTSGLRAPASKIISLEDIPSDLLEGIDVIKSPTASMSSGSLTGAINLRTKQPLDIDDVLLGGSIKNTYSDVAQDHNQKYLAYVGKNWDDQMGVLLQISSEDTLLRNDSINYRNWDGVKFLGADPANQSRSEFLTVSTGGRRALVVAPQEIELEQASVFQEKLATNIGFQFRPTDDLEFGISGVYTDYTETISRNRLEFSLFDIDTQSGNAFDDFTPRTFGEFTPGTNEDVDNIVGEVTLLSGGFRIPGTSANGNSHVQSGNIGFRDVINTNLKFNGKWENDDWTISGYAYRGESEFDSVWLDQGLKGSYGNINCAWRDPRPIDSFSGLPVDCVSNLQFGYNLDDGENGNVFINSPTPRADASAAYSTVDQTLQGVNPTTYYRTIDDEGNLLPSPVAISPNDVNVGDEAVVAAMGIINTSDYLTDPYNYAIGFTGLFASKFTTRSDVMKIDFTRNLEFDYVTSVKFGLRHREKETVSKNYRGVGEHFRPQCTNPAEQLNPAGCAALGASYTRLRIGLEDANSLYVQPESRQNIAAINDGSFMRGVSGSENLSIRQWISGNPAIFADDPLTRVADVWGMSLMSDKSIDQDVTEVISAAYAMANFDFEDFNVTGNFGIRVVDTEITSVAYTVEPGTPSQVLFDDLFLEKDFNNLVAVSSYTDVMPSLNVNWEFAEEWSARFAASKTIDQPDVQDLPPGVRITDVNSLQGRIGNPNLDPWRVNAVDFSLEWYFDEDQGGLVNTALFYKDFTSFITTESLPFPEGVPCAARGRVVDDGADDGVDSPCTGVRSINGTGEVSGIEVGYTQPLPLGFGFQANYTFLDSEDATGLPIPGNSEHTYNVMAFYEDYGVGVRLAYTWQDDSLNTASGFGGNAEYTRDRGQLDLSINYDLNDYLSFTLAGTNLTQEGEASYSQIEERLIKVQQFDRSVVFAVRGRL